MTIKDKTEEGAKKTYVAPRLIMHGPFREITQANSKAARADNPRQAAQIGSN